MMNKNHFNRVINSDTHLIWSYFLKMVVYSTALCCSSACVLLLYRDVMSRIILKYTQQNDEKTFS